MDLAFLTSNLIFQYGLVFARFGAMLLFLPAISESYVSARARLALGVLISIILYPAVKSGLPNVSDDLLKNSLPIISEVTIGLFLGLYMRAIQSLLHTAGMIIAFMTGLSTAMMFDANQSTQGSVIGGFLTIVGITLYFATNMHHYALQAIFYSYELFPVNEMPPLNDFANSLARIISDSFVIAFQISAPVMIVSTMLYLTAGLMGRLMPTMQVFFVVLPVQIYIGFLFLVLSLSTMFLVYMNFYEEKVKLFLPN
jgi:flagellar biosynthetic protein FliR